MVRASDVAPGDLLRAGMEVVGTQRGQLGEEPADLGLRRHEGVQVTFVRRCGTAGHRPERLLQNRRQRPAHGSRSRQTSRMVVIRASGRFHQRLC